MPRILRLLVAAIGFGVLMGAAPVEAGYFAKALLASSAGAWFVLWSWWPFVDRTRPSPNSLVRWSSFAAGVVGFGILMGLRDGEQEGSTRALLAGLAMAWLVAVGRPLHAFARGVT